MEHENTQNPATLAASILGEDPSDVTEPMMEFRVTLPESMRAEFTMALEEMIYGRRSRMSLLEEERGAITKAAMEGLQKITTALNQRSGTHQCRTLAQFLAALYNGFDYRFDATYLRGLDTELANACLAYLNFDRLGIDEVHQYLPGGAEQLHRWLEDNDVPKAR